jgi:hypothetical protein
VVIADPRDPRVPGVGAIMQPFQGLQKVILEKRKEDGSLDFSGEQPPARTFTFNQVYDLFFRANPALYGDYGLDGTWENLKKWLDSKGWKVRAKTW